MKKGLEYLGDYNNNNFKFFQMAVETYEDIGMVSEGYKLLNQICQKVSNKQKIQLLIFKLDMEFRDNNFLQAEKTCQALIENVQKEKGYDKEEKEDILDEYRQVYQQLKSKNIEGASKNEQVVDQEKAEIPLKVYKAKKDIEEAIYNGSGLFKDKKLDEAR